MERIEIRPVTADDAPALYRRIDRNREYLAEWLPWATPEYSEDQLRTFLTDRAAENAARAALTTLIVSGGVVCGSIALHALDHLRKSTSIGYWIDSKHQGRGFATAACRAIITEAFATYGMHRVEIRCAVGNDRSAA